MKKKIHNAEEYLDKFKFSAAQTEIDDAHELMDQYENNYNQQVSQVDEVLAYIKTTKHYTINVRSIIVK